MYKAFFENSEWLTLPVLVLAFFFVVFLSVLVWVLRAKRETIDRVSRLPLEDDPNDNATPCTGRVN